MNIKSSLLILIMAFVINKGFSQNKYGNISHNKAVNISGKQRMLTQKMSKAYLYLFNNPADFSAKKDLKISKIIFSKQLDILEKNAQTRGTKENLRKVRQIWVKFDDILDLQPDKTNVTRVINTNTTLLKLANAAVESIVLDASTTKTGSFTDEDNQLKQTINTCGKLRMLSQRMTLYYFANSREFKTSKSEKILKDSYNEIKNIVNKLMISNLNDERIDMAFGEASLFLESIQENETRYFNQGIDYKEAYEISDKLTAIFNKITNLYERVKVN